MDRQRLQTLAIALIVGVALLLPAAAHAGPPKELYGKSIEVSWTESREQRPVGDPNWRTVNGTETFDIYVSEAGRVFNRMTAQTPGGRASGKGQIAGEGKRSVNFSGHSLTAVWQMGAAGGVAGGGATLVSADFDASFNSCSAKVSRGKESPDAIVRVYSNIIKHENEVRRHQVGSVSCSIRSGNVFAQ
jgi:hypothetical protein